jgi:hypothetical protein
MGEEMTEQMSEEITKAMDEQRALEQRYAMLVKRRGELKGLSHKQELAETKDQIMVCLHFWFTIFITVILLTFLNKASFKRPQELHKKALSSALGQPRCGWQPAAY